MKYIRLFILFLLFSAFCAARAETYVVVVGIAKYKNISSLRLCEKDAKTIAKLYKVATKNVITITGRYATKDWITKCITQQFARAKMGDMIVFAFSGHGFPGGFCPYDMTQDVSTGLLYKELAAVMKNSKATRKIIIADACNSGAIRVNKQDNEGKYDSKDVLLFLSSRGNESSQERLLMQNGLFTTYFIKGMKGMADADKNKKVTAKELFTYVHSNVVSDSADKQHPVMWGNFDDDFVMFDWN